jgi:uridine phosphorylase
VTFPQHRRKHLARPLFTAEEFHRYAANRRGTSPPRPPKKVVFVFGRGWRRYLGRKYRGTLDRRTDIYWVRPAVGVTILEAPGAPYTAIVVEELAALGVRQFVIVGIAGSLQSELRVGSLVLCDRALRDEGTSHHYTAPSRFARPSPELTATLRSALEHARTSFAIGPTWTTDAPYRETIAEIRRYRREGILTVEMEASALFSVARLRGRESAALFVISDHLDERGWEPRFHDSRPGLRRALGVVIEALAE